MSRRRAVIGAFVVSGLTLTGLFAGPLALTCADEAKPTELEQMVIDLIGDKDKDLRSAGLEQVRSEVKGASATRVFASQLPKLTPSAQVGLLARWPTAAMQLPVRPSWNCCLEANKKKLAPPLSPPWASSERMTICPC